MASAWSSGSRSATICSSRSSAFVPASSRIALPSDLVTTMVGPMGRHPWLTIARTVSGPSSTTPTAPRSATRSSSNNRVEPGPELARGHAADHRHGGQQLVGLLDEAVDGEGVRVGQQDRRDRLGVRLRHADDGHAIGVADHLEVEGPDAYARERGDPDAHRMPGLDPEAVADHAGDAAAEEGRSRAEHADPLRDGARVVGLVAADEHAHQVWRGAGELVDGLLDGPLGRPYDVGIADQTVTEPRHRHPVCSAPVIRLSPVCAARDTRTRGLNG